jgi:peroxiredoxin
MNPKYPLAFLIALLWLLGATQCNTQSVASISGTIQLSEGWKPQVYLIQPRSFAEIASNFSGVVLDSARIGPDGRFAFSKAIPTGESTLFQLCMQKTDNRFPNQILEEDLLLSNYMPLVVHPGEKIQIATDADHFQANFRIENPSAENQALLQLRDIRQQAYRQESAKMKEDAHADEAALLEREDALQRFRQPLMRFADSSASIWPALLAIRWVSPASDYERVPEFIWAQCEKWSKQVPGNPWATQLCVAGSREKLPVLIGDPIPDFPLPMAAGDTVMLHQLLGKRITILDIWASWCAPCRRENREVLAPVWALYKNQGLQILGYSIDSSPAAWKAAIAKDGADWPHASHLSGDDTPFLKALRLSTIPANFILDAKGNVMAKNLHGDALKAFLEEYLK